MTLFTRRFLFGKNFNRPQDFSSYIHLIHCWFEYIKSTFEYILNTLKKNFSDFGDNLLDYNEVKQNNHCKIFEHQIQAKQSKCILFYIMDYIKSVFPFILYTYEFIVCNYYYFFF
jgi:hypothetical protein